MNAKSVSFLLFAALSCLVFASQPCTNLKIKTSETVLDSTIPKERPPLWIAPDYTTVLTLTSGRMLYRSTDAGRTFTKLDFAGTDTIRDVQLAADKKFIVVAAGTNLYTSNDGGATWKAITPPGKMADFKFHPRRTDYILAQKQGCPGFNCSNDLYLSQDYGQNWMLLRTYVWSYDWHGNGQDDSIIVWERNQKTGSQQAYPFTSQVVKSEHFFRSVTAIIAEDVVGYLAISTHIFVAKEERSGGLSLLVSTDYGATFHDTRFPGGNLENRYTILDTSQGSTFVNVDHSSFFTSNWGNIYSGDSFDSDFTLSLYQNPRATNGKCDFKRVQGLEGIYLANKYTKTGNDASQTGSGKQTIITYDKGGSWKRLPKPVNYKATCEKEDDCMLNLYGNTNSGEWYSRAEAVGIIISSGLVGPYIVTDQTQMGVYFSRDAGWTWEYITNGSYTYEIGNRGAILLMALDIVFTKEMSYSIDEGLHWQTCEMTNTTFDVDDIVSDPKMASGTFLIHGSRNGKGVIVHVDFADVHENDCVGVDAPDTPASDYETWEPSDALGSNCLLGRRTKYIRRKRESKCDNPADLTTANATLVKNCSCNEQNYQCDYCFTRVGGLCQLDQTVCGSYDPKKPPANCQGTWYETKGYRRVPGDTCDPVSGIDHLPTLRACPDVAPQAPSIQPVPPVSTGSPIPPIPPVSTGFPIPPVSTGFPIPPVSPAPPVPPVPSDISSNKGMESDGTGIIVFLFILAAVALVIAFVWFTSGRNAQLRETLTKCIPEKFLPDFKVPGAQYSALGEDVDDDAPVLNIDNDSDGESDKTPEPTSDKSAEKQDGDDSAFNPRG